MVKRNLITVLCLLVLTAMLVSCSSKNSGDNAESPSEGENNDNNLGSSDNSQTQDPMAKHYTLTFFDYKGKLLEIASVSENGSYDPSSLSPVDENAVFLGWDGSLDNITKDTEYRPIYENISDTRNAVFFSSIYAGAEGIFELSVKVGGDVCLSVIELEIDFSDGIEYIETLYTDGDAVAHYNAESGKLRLALASVENIDGFIDLCSLKLKAVTSMNGENAVKIKINDIASFDEETKNFVTETYKLVEGKIYKTEE